MTGSKTLLMFAALIALPFGAGPAAAQQATQFKPPAVGAVFTHRVSVDGKSVGAVRSIVLKNQAPFEGLLAYRIKEEYMPAKAGKNFVKIQVLGAKHGNPLANLNAKGETVSRVRPHFGFNNWPMFVGKIWTHSYSVEAKGRKSKEGPFTWKVAAYEIVTVPAGNFAAFRIEGKGLNEEFKRWFAPKLGFDVKLVANGKGGGTNVLELTKVVVPKPKNPTETNPGQPPDSQ